MPCPDAWVGCGPGLANTRVSDCDLGASFARFMTWFTVVTARSVQGEPDGFTANSFTSVSLDPPLLPVCPGHCLSRFAVFETACSFGVSVLAKGQEEVSNLFASGTGDRFAHCDRDARARRSARLGRVGGF